MGMLQDLDHTQEMPSKADICLWTHGDDDDDDEDTVCAMLDAPEDAEELEDAEDLEDTCHLYRMVTSKPYD